MRARHGWLLGALLALVGACSDATPAPPMPQWDADPQQVDNPLPDDRLLEGGAIHMRAGFHSRFLPAEVDPESTAALYDRHAELYAELDGWGTYASMLVPFSERLDAAPAESFALVRLDAEAPPVPLQAVNHPELSFVELLPEQPLESRARYAYVVKRGLTASGVEVERPAGFEPSSEVVSASGIHAEDILLGVELTTRDVREELITAASQLVEAQPLADFEEDTQAKPWPHGVYERDAFLAFFADDPSRQSLLATGLEQAGTVAVGTFGSLDFRDPSGAFARAYVDGTETPGAAEVELFVILPDPAAHPPPWPTVLAQHGFGGSIQVVIERAEMFNRHGIAVVGIDALGHGNRGSFLDFFDPADPRVGRDNIRQTVLDQLQLCRVVVAGGLDLDGEPGPDLDGSCHYWGQSMGAMLGALHMAVTSDDKIGVLNVGGGGISRILLSDTLEAAFGFLLAPELGLSLGEPAFDAALPLFMWSTQTHFEGGDPINYGPLVREGNAGVLMQIAVDDGIMPNDASQALATAIGLTELTEAQTAPQGIDGAWWIDLRDVGIDVSGAETHDVTRLVEGVRIQAGTYVASERTELVDPTR